MAASIALSRGTTDPCAHDEVSSRSAASSALSSRAPSTVWTSPSLSTSASAGWVGMPKRVYTFPWSSLICGKVSVWRSTKSWNADSSPDQATP